MGIVARDNYRSLSPLSANCARSVRIMALLGSATHTQGKQQAFKIRKFTVESKMYHSDLIKHTDDTLTIVFSLRGMLRQEERQRDCRP